MCEFGGAQSQSVTSVDKPIHKHPKPRRLQLPFSLPHYKRITYYQSAFPTMVRHKKDGFAAKGKKYNNNPRQRGPPRHNPNDASDDSGPPARPSFRAACWDLGHCDPKRCSGRKLMKQGLMRELAIGQKHSGVIITPNGKSTVSPADRETMEAHGAAVVE